MKIKTILLLLSILFAIYSMAQQLSNGGFEEIQNSFPIGWIGYIAGKGNAEVKLTTESHSGKYAILLKAKKDSVAGLNRTYPTGKKGEEMPLGDLFPRLKGVFTFWFKVKKAGKDNVRFYVIPMGKDNLEIGPARTTFIIPSSFAGDDKWHFGAIAYDYTGMKDVRSVQVAPRINEGGNDDGEVIIDDISYVDSIGPFIIPQRMELDGNSFICSFKNVGDKEAQGLKAHLTPPSGIQVDSSEKNLDLKPGEEKEIQWKLSGESKGKVAFQLSWNANPQVEDSLSYAAVYEPSLKIKQFSTARAVLFRDDSYELRLILSNEGLATAKKLSISLSSNPFLKIKEKTKAPESIPPSPESEIAWELKPLREGIHKLKLQVNFEGGKEEKEVSFIVSKHFPSYVPWERGIKLIDKNGDLILQNDDLRLIFPKNPFGYGVFALDVKDTRAGFMRMAFSPYLADLLYRRRNGKEAEIQLYAQKYEKKESADEVQLIFPIAFKDDDGVNWNMNIRFTAKKNDKNIGIDWDLSAEHSVHLLAIHCPRLYVGEGEFGSDKDYALFPGLFYMLKGETSISTEFADPPFNDQHAPHPYKITVPLMTLVKDKHLVGIMWDPLQKWDGVNVCPSALFASPNWLEGEDNHLFGLFLPSIPRWVKENEEKASEPYLLNPQVKLSLRCWFIGGYPLDITDSIDFYFEKFGVPPLPLRVRNYEEELQLCGWSDIPPRYQRLLGEVNSLAQRCAIDMATQREDGSWGFKMDPQNTEMLKRFNPKRPNLGAEGDTTIGTCTFLNGRATALLRYTRFNNNQLTWEAGLKGLNYITDNFTRPEGAQTWEIPLHAPDILASANGVHLYLEAYKITGDKEYLKRAVFWAKTGLPFVYVWNAPDRPTMMRYATTPIFGVSFYNAAPWFGIPVQWCGLDYAYSLLKLAEYDDSYPWRQIAEGITLCAMQMQTTEGKHKGGYPDSVNLMTYTKSDPGMLNPAGIARNVYAIRNPAEDPQGNSFFLIVQGDKKIMVNSEAPSISGSIISGNLLLSLKAPRSVPGKPISTYTIIAPVERPSSVLKEGKELSTNMEAEEWWRYEERNGGLLVIKIKHDKSTINLKIEGIKARENRAPLLTAKPDWQFNVDNDAEGWSEAHDLAPFVVSGGTLKGRSTGGDPYMTSPFFRVSAKDYPFVSLRIKFNPLPAGAVPDAQIFWAREDETGMTESKSMHFPIIPDGQWHIYNVKVADSPEWKGTIVQIRLDPGSGGEGIQFEIDWIKLSPKEEG